MHPPDDSKLTRLKTEWASKRRTPATGQPTLRLPPGQHPVTDWPVLDLGEHPAVDRATWQLSIQGLVEHPQTLDWSAFAALTQIETRSDIHCVTSWSRLDNRFGGVSTATVIDLVRPLSDARAILLYGEDGYTTNLTLADFAAPEAVLAHSWQGAPLTVEHGAPVRLVVPHLYFWKSAKWLRGIEFIAADEPGFWEERGYHMRGDPWRSERYR